MRKIGLLGGTFDPPHYGHLLMAEQVKEQLHLDEIWFMPNQQPPHKNNAKTDGQTRLKMIDLAIQDNHAFKTEGIELKRSGKSYTIDTIRQLREMYPSTTFYFIIGGDMVEYLPKWHAIDELIQLVTFIGVNRKGYKRETEYPVIEVDIPTIELSSTMIREKVKNNQSIQYTTPKVVVEFIHQKKLYK
ncbi:nicotinate-nucleotide adenylyltransferase [Gracilibacillus marinus]|jgi:nicotinate-nucleotide adenylyltransferase|uniref:Probable nicotinate-nucleotide adenylyltransferase n=1 Tax=Gracilibacillus marinus TaxID=630535 RepID=A0ABV8VV79_9BACI